MRKLLVWKRPFLPSKEALSLPVDESAAGEVHPAAEEIVDIRQGEKLGQKVPFADYPSRLDIFMVPLADPQAPRRFPP